MRGRTALGHRAELAVVDYLVVRRFSILGQNVRLGALELDVVARQGPLVAVVEVRTRGKTSYQRPFESLDATKRARLQRAVRRLWREQLKAMPGVERVRIDVAAVTFEAGVTSVEYVEGAI
ncbi:MAG: YraN family protein [Polyangiaceae bacterium]